MHACGSMSFPHVLLCFLPIKGHKGRWVSVQCPDPFRLRRLLAPIAAAQDFTSVVAVPFLIFQEMKTERVPNDNSAASTQAMNSCRRKGKDDATFLEDVKDHIDEFINASMEGTQDLFPQYHQEDI